MRITLWAVATLCTLPACRGERSGAAAGADAAIVESRPETPARSCGVAAGTPLTGSGIGDLRVGAPTATIKERCLVLADTTRAGPEGTSERVLIVRLSSDTVTATVVDDEVWRIEIATPRFRTADSLGVGSRVAMFRGLRDLQAVSGEGPYYLLTASHCGLSFALPPQAVPGTLYGQTLEGAGLRLLADSLQVHAVLVSGCHVN